MVGPRITSAVNPRIKSLEQALRLTATDMQAMLTPVDTKFRTLERRLFATEGASGGARWRRLSPKYAKQKRRTHPGRKVMQKTGGLRRSLTQKGADHVARYTLSASRARLKVGTTNVLAAYHGPLIGRLTTGSGLGPTRGRARLPVRDVMQMTPQQRRLYYKIVKDYLVDVKLKRAMKALRIGRQEMRIRRRS